MVLVTIAGIHICLFSVLGGVDRSNCVNCYESLWERINSSAFFSNIHSKHLSFPSLLYSIIVVITIKMSNNSNILTDRDWEIIHSRRRPRWSSENSTRLYMYYFTPLLCKKSIQHLSDIYIHSTSGRFFSFHNIVYY